jgi:cell wall-associated NlpC family hydrolase
MTTTEREAVVAEAKTWVNTRYVGWSEVKGRKGGTDCGMLLKAVFQHCDLIPQGNLGIDMSYSLQANQHEADTVYRTIIERFCREIPEDEVLPGDIVMYQLNLGFSHAGIVVSWPDTIIHCLAHGGVKYSHGNTHPQLAGKPRKFYTLKEDI